MKLSTGRPRWVARLRQHLTPMAFGYAFFAVLGFSAIIGSLANLLSIQQALKVGGSASTGIVLTQTPKPHQYENHIRIHSKRGTVTLPVHEGYATDILGPVDVPVGSLEAVTWDPTPAVGVISGVRWVFAISDMDGVTITGTGGDTFTLGPGAYIPEELILPFTITNPGAFPAHVTLVVGVDFIVGGGGVGTT